MENQQTVFIFESLKRVVKYHEAYGNISALGLGKLVCMRQVAVVWGTHGDMRVIHGIGYQKTCRWTKIVARASKMEPEGDKRDKRKAQGSQMEPQECQKAAKWSQKDAKRGANGRSKCLQKSADPVVRVRAL